MRISELVIGEFYIINPRTRKEVVIEENSLRFASQIPVPIKNRIYKESLYIYAGQQVEKVEKKVDKGRKEVYTYKPHYLLCVKTGERLRIASYYLQTYFTKPKK